MQDKAVVPQVPFWGGIRYLYYYFLEETSNPQEGRGSYKQPPGAAFELDLGLMRSRLLQRGFDFIISDSVYRASQAETPKSHSSPLKKCRAVIFTELLKIGFFFPCMLSLLN